MRSTILRKFIGATAVLWTLVVFGFFTKDAFHLQRTIRDLATSEARTHFNKDQATRLWAASRGGIYVPVTEDTPPNPYLSNVPERDIVTSDGKRLTLMNPAYVSRQLMDHYAELFGVRAHITSMDYFRSETAPDDWEKKALLAFEQNRREVIEISEIDGKQYLRLMKPLITEASCLKCHQNQGYRPGDIRGGVSISIPMKPYTTIWRQDIASNVVSFGLIWILGLVGLFACNRKISGPLDELEKAESSLRASQENYRILVENSLTGIYVTQDDRIVFANSEFARMHGYEPDEIIGRPSLSVIHPDDRQTVAGMVSRLYQGQPLSEEYRVKGLTRKGATIYVQRRNALTAYNGQSAVIGNEIDVTSHMVAEAELAVSERQLQKLADGLIELREIERERFAKDIHENIAQCLSAIKFQMESALKDSVADPPAVPLHRLHPIIVDIQYTLAEIRKIARQYDPVGLEHMGMISSIAWLCNRFESDHPGIQIQRAFHIGESDIPDPLKIIVFRMAEQMLHSVSGQPDARVKTGMELVSDKIVFYLSTNVSAVDLDSSPQAGFLQVELAMIALRRRIEKFGGTLQLSSGQGKDTLLIATWDTCCRYPAEAADANRGDAGTPILDSEKPDGTFQQD